MFMDLYDAKEPIETIRATAEQRADNDEVDDEIFITAHALALLGTTSQDQTNFQVSYPTRSICQPPDAPENAPSEGRKDKRF
jgi:hypothetical protein